MPVHVCCTLVSMIAVGGSHRGPHPYARNLRRVYELGPRESTARLLLQHAPDALCRRVLVIGRVHRQQLHAAVLCGAVACHLGPFVLLSLRRGAGRCCDIHLPATFRHIPGAIQQNPTRASNSNLCKDVRECPSAIDGKFEYRCRHACQSLHVSACCASYRAASMV